ncbi:MAG: AMP-binding protein [Acidobacteria bacterium]|nr:AMP-binding protein [Acidobacteriota bacterium]MXZ36977.1 AMP-binding protein [Holophagales bacterium]MYF05829.1 AMP-binding protein [Holophagales bacterium]
MNLYALLYERFAAAFDRPALALHGGGDGSGSVTWTYGDLDRASAGFATALRRRGVAPGDRVLVQVPKSPEAVALYLGVLRCGGVYVPLNTAYTEREVAFFSGDASPRVVVGAEVDGPLGVDIDALRSEAPAQDAEPTIEPRDDDDLAAICYTSGTTGRSKGATITHHNLTSNALALHRIWGFEPGDVLLHALPIFHVHGLFVALHTAFLNASKVLFLPKFDAAEVRRLLPEATVLMGVPTFYSRLLAEPGFGSADCESIRLFVSGSAPLTEAVFGDFRARTGHRILERYGMTEAGMITSNPLNGERVAGTVGFPLPDVEVRAVGEDGAEVPAGEVGTLEIRGPNLFAGYWGLPDKTAAEMRGDGFFVTGDLASVDGEGRVTLVGRDKDLIIAGGFNVYPKEVEDRLDEIAGVAESAVIGAPHADLGEGVVAVLVAEGKPLEDDTLRAALDAGLARYKHPRRCFWVDELPRNAMGKVQKNVLRERYRDAYDG